MYTHIPSYQLITPTYYYIWTRLHTSLPLHLTDYHIKLPNINLLSYSPLYLNIPSYQLTIGFEPIYELTFITTTGSFYVKRVCMRNWINLSNPWGILNNHKTVKLLARWLEKYWFFWILLFPLYIYRFIVNILESINHFYILSNKGSCESDRKLLYSPIVDSNKKTPYFILDGW